MKKAIHEAIKPVNLITPAARATDGTTHNGQASGNVGYDLTALKAREVGVLIILGAIAAGGTLAVTLKHGDVVGTGDASYVGIVDGTAAANAATKSIVAGDAGKIFLGRLRSDALKAFLDVQIVQAGGNVAINYGVALLIGDPLTEAIAQVAGTVFFTHSTY